MFRFFENRLDPFPQSRTQVPPSSLVRFCLHYTRDALPWLLFMSLAVALLAVGEVMLFTFLGQLVDWLAAADKESFLDREGTRLAIMTFILLIALPLLNLIASLLTHQTLLGNLPMSARWRMHQHLLRQSMQFFADEFAGRLSTKVMQTALGVREVVMKLLDILVFVVVYFLTMLVVIAGTDLRLAIPFVVWLLAYSVVTAWFVPRLSKISERQANARSTMTGRIVDSYTNIATVKLFAHAGNEAEYAKKSMQKFLGTVHPQMRLVTLFEITVYFLNSLVVFATTALAIVLWLDGLVSIGAIAAAIAMILRINGMSQWIMWEVSALFENLGVIHDGMAMMNAPVNIEDAKNAAVFTPKRGAISFDRVCFHYGKGAGIIDELNLTIAPGEKIGLVGRSGAGKTTLTNLLLRFYDVESGRILIDGQDVREVSQDSLRAHIGIVTQDTSLLHRSIRENIAYGSPSASDEQIARAVERANAGSFVNDLEDQKGRRGLAAHVGERGVKLSGGQRQRIAIARLFLKDAPILILDEATSALDSEVEAAIQENLFALMEGKTVIAIAHRLSTIAAMDRLIVLDEGKVIEQGRHDELIKTGGLYADLWARQSGGFLGQRERPEPGEQDARDQDDG